MLTLREGGFSGCHLARACRDGRNQPRPGQLFRLASPDNTRVYVALQYCDGLDVIDTKTKKVIKTLHVGQAPTALVYVARSTPGSTAGLSQQSPGMRNGYLPVTVQGATGKATVQVRALPGVDEVVPPGWLEFSRQPERAALGHLRAEGRIADITESP